MLWPVTPKKWNIFPHSADANEKNNVLTCKHKSSDVVMNMNMTICETKHQSCFPSHLSCKKSILIHNQTWNTVCFNELVGGDRKKTAKTSLSNLKQAHYPKCGHVHALTFRYRIITFWCPELHSIGRRDEHRMINTFTMLTLAAFYRYNFNLL